MKSISIITPCYNEEANVRELYERVRAVMCQLGRYRYEHIFIDNASEDGTVRVLKSIAARDSNVKILVNMRNFGHIRSPFHALYQASGDAVVGVVADLQDPPEMIEEMVRHWEDGALAVLAIKRTSEESAIMFRIRKAYYRLLNKLSNVETFENFTGFGLYDRKVVDAIKDLDDPYPYFRGMIAEIGMPHVKLYYDQPKRKRGITKNNFYTLYDMAMLGITNFSKVPLRLVTFTGFVGSVLCVLAGLGYTVYKLLYWTRFPGGMAPTVIGLFFVASLQLFFLGIIGEYIGAIHTFVQHRPYVFELDRINFQYEPGEPLRSDEAIRSTAESAQP
ncbi:MAG: glycosyltransferase family 2 protein [Acidobacteria bacterium]|nr:glycosyltransferase family 2 protein [Acidobacteriota bacterium]